ncbi:MAG: alpha/beta hydrolase [Spirochaetes bacterium]|nr:alpha/beta hydrolase [Spirochaetota bacterium]
MKVVFIHGAGGTGAAWYYQAERFPGCDAVNLPGHPGGEPLGSIEEYAEWLYRYIREQGYGTTVLAGHSMGGGIALSCVLSHPDICAGLALIGTGARLRVNPAFLRLLTENRDRPPEWYREYAAAMLDGVDPEVSRRVLDIQCAAPVSTHLNDFLCCDRFDVMEGIATIGIPTLVLCGEGDVMTPVKYSKYLADSIPGSRLVIIPGAGHMVFLQKPEEVNREIEEFFASIS